ncbi:AbiV family abortive infection protein [Priestia aryabhattai]|uniref:AbiV family abortive infection protein n=1 Tax=Priestia aryabhattai TaxID=412384 RepID=UPI001C8DEEAD|nr:AbiV family abortive infection protein [Priestia aryabhattai]MBY0213868.1 AbiV family abortive infection protein [Priestia aryabhattai]
MSFNQLKVEDLENIFSKIYENACELIEEAEILYNHQKYARAYLCAHISFEELGKLPMLNSVALNIYNGIKVDWKYLNKRIRDHKRKISQSYGTVMFLNNTLRAFKGKHENDIPNQCKETGNSIEYNYLNDFKCFLENEVTIDPFEWQEYFNKLDVEKEIKQKYSMTMLLNEYKNGSLYSDFDEGKFLKPSEKIDKETCEYGITLAYMQKKFIDFPNIHKDGFILYKFTEEHNEFLKVMAEKYKQFNK